MITYLAIAWILSAAALIVLGEITQRARKRLEALKAALGGNGVTAPTERSPEPEPTADHSSKPAAEEPELSPQSPTPPPHPEAPTPPSAGEPKPSQRRSPLLLSLSVLAFLFAFLWPVILVLNSYVIALSLSAFLPPIGPLFTLTIGPWVRDIFVNDLIAVVVCLLQAVGGAAWLRCLLILSDEQLQEGDRQVVFRILRFALTMTLLSLLFEVGAAGMSGLLVGDLYNALGRGLAALVAGLGEVVIGALVIDFLLIPLLLALISWLQPPPKPPGPQPPVIVEPLFPWLLRFLVFIDEVLMERLRILDRWVAHRLGLRTVAEK